MNVIVLLITFELFGDKRIYELVMWDTSKADATRIIQVEEGKDTKIRSFVYSAAVTETSALSFN
jgi:hypothetical protein